MQATTTRVPAVITALLASLTTSLPTVHVMDGPRAAQDLPDNVLQVGIGNEDSAEAYSSDTEVQPGLSGRLVETITVNCELSTWSGDQVAGIASLRTLIGGWLATIDTGLRADQQLTATCDRVHLGPRARWYGIQSPDGAGIGVRFQITARAWL
jgi:hypothetical protein